MSASFRRNTFLRESNYIEDERGYPELMKAHKAWSYIVNQDTLTVENVLRTHEILMEKLLQGKDLGEFRTCQVYIGGREGKAWYAVPELIKNWVERMNQPLTEGELEQLHIDYEVIHPFVDGNGRTGRIFWNWGRIKNDFNIKIVYEKEKHKYYELFE